MEGTLFFFFLSLLVSHFNRLFLYIIRIVEQNRIDFFFLNFYVPLYFARAPERTAATPSRQFFHLQPSPPTAAAPPDSFPKSGAATAVKHFPSNKRRERRKRRNESKKYSLSLTVSLFCFQFFLRAATFFFFFFLFILYVDILLYRQKQIVNMKFIYIQTSRTEMSSLIFLLYFYSLF